MFCGYITANLHDFTAGTTIPPVFNLFPIPLLRFEENKIDHQCTNIGQVKQISKSLYKLTKVIEQFLLG